MDGALGSWDRGAGAQGCVWEHGIGERGEGCGVAGAGECSRREAGLRVKTQIGSPEPGGGKEALGVGGQALGVLRARVACGESRCQGALQNSDCRLAALSFNCGL